MPLRIATTSQMIASVRAAGYEGILLPALPDEDIHRGMERRLADGAIIEPFLRRERVDLLLDVDTSVLTLSPVPGRPNEVTLTAEFCGIPYVTLYIDPVTSTMNKVPWAQHWAMLERPSWVKAVWEAPHADELTRLGIPQVIQLPMAIADRDFDTSPPSPRVDGPVVAFMGHPATSWFRSQNPVLPRQLFPGFMAAAVNADAPGTPFHHVYHELYGFGESVTANEPPDVRARKSADYFNAKFVYNAWLAVRQRDRFAIFLSRHLGDRFELIGDFWDKDHGLPQKPTIRDYDELYRRMREVPICLNLVKGCLEGGLNLRHFEVTAVGGFLLTYWTPELPQCFEVGKECEAFRNERELLEKVRYYVAHPEKRLAIAAAGQRRTLRDHLYSRRIRQLVSMLRHRGVLPQQSTHAASADKPMEISVRGVPHVSLWRGAPGGVNLDAARPGGAANGMIVASARIRV
ncbi:MAG: glycosyltransferase [Phycisphaerales bacterium]|nr:glycosyltransferase [Phycisphaerales bacterium]